MKITTESGAVYELVNGVCYKTSHDGFHESPFKVWTLKSVDDDVDTWVKLLNSPLNPPEVGKRLYVSGKYEWWLSTKVVSIEDAGDGE